MLRNAATPHDVALVIAAAKTAAKYTSQNPMSKMELAVLIADIHSILVDRLDSGPRSRVFPQSERDDPIPQTTNPWSNKQPAKPDAPRSPFEKTDPVDDKNRYRCDYIVAPPGSRPFQPIETTVWSNRIICLECGRKCIALKRHLISHRTTELEYRKKFGLSATYPMATEEFRNHRRQTASKNFRPLTKAERQAKTQNKPDRKNDPRNFR